MHYMDFIILINGVLLPGGGGFKVSIFLKSQLPNIYRFLCVGIAV